ncbi:MAG: TraR/DksA family transcriptional regulator [Steroidobacteraceae bacterium]|nr:TraR/DksA family transcriptional regulator [Deltaproteobacteria bacterium]
MDDIDRVQHWQAEFNSDALREHWRNQPIGMGLSHCEECGGQIPAARRQAVPTCTHCVTCQTKIEFKARRPM